jgi:hypothetical protein
MIRTQALADKKVSNTKKRKHKLQPNKTQTIAKLKDFLTDIFYSDKVQFEITQMLKMLNNCYDIV